jgi:hypothetical protein
MCSSSLSFITVYFEEGSSLLSAYIMADIIKEYLQNIKEKGVYE